MKLRALALALLLVPRLAAAGDPTTGDGWYEVGQKQFTLGNFEKAIDAFKRGFEIESDDSKKPAYLYNIAQAYRQANDCKNSVFFYKRFLAMKAGDTKKPLKESLKAEVEGHIRDGEECIKQMEAARVKPPTDLPPDDTKITVVPPPADKIVAPARVVATPPHALSAVFSGGASKLDAGSLNIPVQTTATMLVGHPLAVGPKMSLVLGGGVTFTPVGYVNTITTRDQTAEMFGVIADVGLEVAMSGKVGLRFDAGGGLLVVGGIEQMGSPFTAGGKGTTGALSMPLARGSASVTYALSPSVSATVTPLAFTFAKPAEGMREDITSITRFDVMIGLGYRM